MKRFPLLLLFVMLCICMGTGSTEKTIAAEGKSDTNSNYELIYWESIKNSNSIDMFRAYLKKFPNGLFTDLAEIKIKELQKAPASSSVQVTTPGETKTIGIRLRQKPKRLEDDEIREMVKKHNFCDWYRNYNADFKNDFKDNEDGTITDHATGLTWEKSGSWRKLNLKKTKYYIDDLNRKKFSRRSNWRLPTVEELASLIENKPSGL